jgi:Methane oxygenase PmoA
LLIGARENPRGGQKISWSSTMTFSRRLLFFCGMFLAVSNPAQAEWTVEKTEGGAIVKHDGKIVTEYLTRSGSKPVLWPLNGPDGKPYTRAFPMKAVSGEQKDHPHQRSCWFTHGSVNGIDFWAEPGSVAGTSFGTIEHKDFVTLKSGADEAVIETINDWLGPDDKRQLSDRRRLRFHGAKDQNLIDFDVTLVASDGPVKFGDTKEGSFGCRVAAPLALTSKQGGKIINSDAVTDKEAWGKRASWVDYQGPIDPEEDDVVGIAILNHPASFHYPTFWHVRDYGLFAVNPFGIEDGAKNFYTLEAGKELPLYYQMILHTGDEKQAKIADAFERYSKETRKPASP